MRVMGDNIPEDAQWALALESEPDERDLEQAYDTAVDAAIDAARGK